jgi:hypothetical protein
MAEYTNLEKNKLNRETLINDFDFLNDASQFLYEREDYSSDNPEDIYDRYLEHFRYQNVNEVSAARDMYYVQDLQKQGDQEGLDRVNRLMSTFENSESEFNLETATDYLGGVFTAPSTYVGAFSFGAGKAGAIAAQQGIKFGIKDIIKSGAKQIGTKLNTRAATEGGKILAKTKAKQRWKDGFVGGGYKTAIGGGVGDMIGAGLTASAQEQTRVETDMVDEFSYSSVGLITALSTVAGVGVGAFTGTQKAIQGNIAERFASVEHKLLNRRVDEVYKGVTTKALKNGEIKNISKQLKENLKWGLKETNEAALKEGKELKINLSQSKNLIVSMDDKLIENIAVAGAKIVKGIGPRIIPKEEADIGIKIFKEKGTKAEGAMNPKDFDADGNVIAGSRLDLRERMAGRIGRALSNNTNGFTTDKFLDTLKEYNLTPKQFGALYVGEISQAAKAMGTVGRISKAVSQSFVADLTKLEAAVWKNGDDSILGTATAKQIAVDKTDRGGLLNSIDDFTKGLNKARVGMMTIQTATTVRNTTNGYMRNATYALDNLNQSVYNQWLKNNHGKKYNAKGIKLTDDELKKAADETVKLGEAQYRTAGLSLKYKDMILGMQSVDTAILTRFFKDPTLGNSENAIKLFRELGDVGVLDASSDHGLMIKGAKFLNTLNTMSDNMFKSAVFSREIDKIIRTDVDGTFIKQITKATPNGVTDLASLMKAKGGTGALKFLNERDIAKAMSLALDYTYQTSDFASKSGWFNSSANWFIKQSSSRLGSAFVPFPRYLVNQFRFFHEHAPIIGSLNLGGISNKTGGKKGEKALFNFDNEALGKQTTGLMMLGAFYSMREQLGDETTEWYEFKNPFGHGTFNAKAALGPYSVFALVADAIYKHTGPNSKWKIHDNDKVTGNEPFDWAGLSEAVLGGFGRSGTGLDLIDSLKTIGSSVGGEDDSKTDSTVQAKMAKVIGNYLSTFTVGMGMIKDGVAAIHPEYRLLTDNTDIDFLPYMFKTATRSFPMEAHADGEGWTGEYDINDRRSQTSPTKTTGIVNEQPFLRQVIGLTPQAEKNPEEKEFIRLGIKYRDVTPRKLTDPLLNRESKQRIAIAVKNEIGKMIRSSTYAEMSEGDKKQALLSALGEFKAEAIKNTLDAKEYDSPKMTKRKEAAIFFKLSARDRSSVEREWKILNPGAEFDDDYGDYLDVYYEIVKPKNETYRALIQ